MTNQEHITRDQLIGGSKRMGSEECYRAGLCGFRMMAVLLMAVGATGCQDFYGGVYAYKRSYFVPYERIEAERLAEERAKRDAEKAKDDATRMAAEGLMNAPAAAPMQQGGGGVGAIPGLDPIPGL